MPRRAEARRRRQYEAMTLPAVRYARCLFNDKRPLGRKDMDIITYYISFRRFRAMLLDSEI